MDETKAKELIVAGEVRARAVGKLIEPEDAARYLDLSAFNVSDDGKVDGEKIDRAIDSLLKKKPYLKRGGRAGTDTPQKVAPRVAEILARVKRRTGIS
jgi:hypothetical protein